MKIVMTGGGTAGHVTPNIALLPALQQKGFDIFYIGTDGVEKELIEQEGIPFYSIKAGKLRRYLDMQNLKDIGRIMQGHRESLKLLKKLRPDVVFSKGGFVSCPVVWAAKQLKIPVVIHESDITPGLANKLCLPFADKICCSFPETMTHLKDAKSIYTGLPVRSEILSGDKARGLSLCGFTGDKPMLLIMGGSQGSVFLNNCIRENLETLLKTFDICHLCGKGNVNEELMNLTGYCQFDYINKELPDLMQAADVFVSRAGATAIFEMLAQKKPMLLIPLSRRASRGDQILNAKSFTKQGFAEMIEEEDLTAQGFTDTIESLYRNKKTYTKQQAQANPTEAVTATVNVILSAVKR